MQNFITPQRHLRSGDMMRRLACIMLVIAILSPLGFVDANSGNQFDGVLTSETMWFPSQYPVKLYGDLTVPAGVTLTILPGVKVDLGQYRLIVNGVLKSNGTSESPVVITSSIDKNSIYWANAPLPECVTLKSGSVGSAIKHTIITEPVFFYDSVEATNSSFQALGLYSGSSRLYGNEINGLYVYNGSAVITCNKITDILVRDGTPEIVNNTINWRGSSGFWEGRCMTVWGGQPMIANNTITGRAMIGDYDGAYGVHSSPVFLGNTFLDGIDLEGANQATVANNFFRPSENPAILCQIGNASISNNSIFGTNKSQTGIEVQNIITYSSFVDPETKILKYFGVVEANESFFITGNYISNCQIAISAGHGNAIISNNTISGNSIGINVNPSYYSTALNYDTRADNTTLSIQENIISNNSVGVQYDNTPVYASFFSDVKELANWISDGKIVAYQSVVIIRYNDIYDNTEYNFRQYRGNYTLANSVEVTATNNWWGTTDYNAISQSIYDKTDDPALGAVTFTPFNTSPSNSASTSMGLNSPTFFTAAAVGVCVAIVAAVLIRKRARKTVKQS
jgi:hypothetical protein